MTRKAPAAKWASNPLHAAPMAIPDAAIKAAVDVSSLEENTLKQTKAALLTEASLFWRY